MRRTILVADDSPTIQRLVAQTFADGDFDIIAVSNGDAAVRKLDETRPDAILADIYMPGKNGYEVCTYVKNHASLSSTPVILLVGAFDAFDEATARRAGAAANITKPFEPQALVSLVLSVMSEERAESAAAVESPAAVEDPPAVAETEIDAEPDPLPPAGGPAESTDDLLGLNELFKPPESPSRPASLTEEEVDRIADRVIQKLSVPVIESIAWDVVPDLMEKVLRDEFKRKS